MQLTRAVHLPVALVVIDAVRFSPCARAAARLRRRLQRLTILDVTLSQDNSVSPLPLCTTIWKKLFCGLLGYLATAVCSQPCRTLSGRSLEPQLKLRDVPIAVG